MPVILPLEPSTPNSRVGTTLGGVQYILDVRWNERDGAWYMDVLTQNERPVASGLKLVIGSLIGRRVVDPEFPQGLFVCADLSGEDRDAGLDDLGTRVTVAFYTIPELLFVREMLALQDVIDSLGGVAP